MEDTTSQTLWYLEAGGQKTGPFTQDQLSKFWKAGRVHPTQRVTTESMNGVWMTAAELFQGLAPRSEPQEPVIELDLSPAPAEEPLLTLEPAPIEPAPTITKPAPTPPPVIPMDPPRAPTPPPAPPTPGAQASDDTRKLFDLLLTTKAEPSKPRIVPPPPQARNEGGNGLEKLAQTLQSLQARIAKTDLSQLRMPRIPPQGWVIGVVSLLLILMVWGVSSFLKKRAANLATAPGPTAEETAQRATAQSPAIPVPPPAPPPIHHAPPPPPVHVPPPPPQAPPPPPVPEPPRDPEPEPPREPEPPPPDPAPAPMDPEVPQPPPPPMDPMMPPPMPPQPDDLAAPPPPPEEPPI